MTIDPELNDIEHVRKRPSMYLGSTGFFGFIHYLVCAVNIFLERSPTWISVKQTDAQFRIESDAKMHISVSEGESIPFEKFGKNERSLGMDAPIVNALSAYLRCSASDGERCQTVKYEQGSKTDSHSTDSTEVGTSLEFSPDEEIFAVPAFSNYNFDSYLRRISHFHPGIRFSFTAGGQTRHYHATAGIRAMFDSVATPYQILHEPIHIRHEDGNLSLEMVWAYHSWNGDVHWSFVNNGRAVDGGYHETGIKDAFRILHKEIGLPNPDDDSRNGVIAIVSIYYRGALWEGCIKAKIGNEELQLLVSNAIINETKRALSASPEIRDQIQILQTFPFPDMWIASRGTGAK